METVQLWALSLTNTVTLGKLVNWDGSPFLQLQRCKETINTRNDSKKKKKLSRYKCLPDRNFEGQNYFQMHYNTWKNGEFWE